MKTFIKTCTVAAMVLVFFGCEPEEDAIPLVDNQSFTESELKSYVQGTPSEELDALLKF